MCRGTDGVPIEIEGEGEGGGCLCLPVNRRMNCDNVISGTAEFSRLKKEILRLGSSSKDSDATE
jgi:hypothetical protein